MSLRSVPATYTSPSLSPFRCQQAERHLPKNCVTVTFPLAILFFARLVAALFHFFCALCHLCVEACHLFNYARVGDSVGCKLYSYSMREVSALGANFAMARPRGTATHIVCEYSRNTIYAKFRSTTLNEISALTKRSSRPCVSPLCTQSHTLLNSQQDFCLGNWKPINQWHTLRPLTTPTEEKVQGHNPTWCRHKYANHVIHNAWPKPRAGSGEEQSRAVGGAAAAGGGGGKCIQATKR